MTEVFSDLVAPEPSADALNLMPAQAGNFLSDLLTVLYNALSFLESDFSECIRLCLLLILVGIILGLIRTFSGKASETVSLAGAILPGLLLLTNTKSLVSMASKTVQEMSEYGKLLLPILTTAMAGQGAGGTSTALYAVTMLADSILCKFLTHMLIPLVYAYLLLRLCNAASKDRFTDKLSQQLNAAMGWILKISITTFTAFLSVTGIITGATDAAALKAIKLTISNMVPLVGGILSDASEAVLVGARVVKNTAGVYGLIAMIAILATPFFKIGVQYLCLKFTGMICATVDNGSLSEVVSAFATAMGMLLAMIGSIGVIHMVSIICFLKGMGG